MCQTCMRKPKVSRGLLQKPALPVNPLQSVPRDSLVHAAPAQLTDWFCQVQAADVQEWPRCPVHVPKSSRRGRLEPTKRLASMAFADEVSGRSFRAPLCRFLRNVFIAEFARDVGSVSPSFSSAIKQRASWDCFSEASKTPSIGSNSTNAQAFSNAMLKSSVSLESKKP
jgi:hypothetical protein